MTTVEAARFGNGQVEYRSEVEPVPPTSEKTGNVTVNVTGSEGVSAHYKVTFMIQAELEESNHALNNIFHWSLVVPSEDENASYRDVEDQAARQIAPTLRAVADLVDQQIAEFDKNRDTLK